MPLSNAAPRREIHHRVIEMRAFARNDGGYDIEAHLVDTKPFAYIRIGSTHPHPAGAPLHDLSIRMTIDAQLVVQRIEAASDVTPFGVCKETESTLAVLVGERIASGWSRRVKERMRGAASCTHLMEMLIPMGTTALQGIRALDTDQSHPAAGAEAPYQIDSCYAFARHRDVVKRVWPLHYHPAHE